MTDATQTTPELPPVKIAFVIDGEVVDVLHTDDRLGALFLSQPTIVDATEWVQNNPEQRLVGGTWDGQNFTAGVFEVTEVTPPQA